MIKVMKKWPEYNEQGDLPLGIHGALLSEVIDHFGKGSLRRTYIAERLQRIFRLINNTGHLLRFIVFGSFITSKSNPQDIDIFILMDNDFDVSKIKGETKILFDHIAAQNYEGASIFWLRQMSAFEGEDEAVNYWQLKRDGNKRGIVEVLKDDK